MNIQRYDNVLNINYASALKFAPSCIIENDSNKFWNGYEWIYEKTHLKMELVYDNVYYYNIKIENSSHVTIKIIDILNDLILDLEVVDIASKNIVENIHKGAFYLFKVKSNDDVTIVKKTNGESVFSDLMNRHEESDIFTYMLQFNDIGEFVIELTQNENILKTYTMIVEEFIPGSYRKYITHEILRQSDGDDTRVIDDKGRYLYGVKVFAKNKDTGEEFETTTDNKGEWGMELTSGRYIFLFDLNNYSQASLEGRI